MNQSLVSSATQLVLTSSSFVDFAEAYFRDPEDDESPLKLEPGQKKAINALQFGYDYEETPVGYVNKKPPKGVIMIWPRQSGKSTGVSVFCASALCLIPRVQIGLIAHTEPGAKALIDKIKTFLKNSPFKDKVENYLKLQIEMKDGGIVRVHSNSEGIRGFSYHYLIADEAAKIDDETIEGAALHTTRKIGKRWVLLSTPKGYRGVLVKYYIAGLRTRLLICKRCFTEFTQAHFENVRFDALSMSPGMPPCPECGYFEEDQLIEYGIDSRKIGKTYFFGTGEYSVISVDPWSCSFYKKEDIIEELQKMGNSPLARQELLGEIIPEGQAVFTLEKIEIAYDQYKKNVLEVKPGVNYSMGVDFGKIHDNSVICVGHEDRESKEGILDYIKIIKSMYSGKEYEDIKDEIIDVARFFNPSIIVPDATGMGGPIVEQMEKDLRRGGWHGKIYCNKSNALGFVFDQQSKPDVIENLQNYFMRNIIKLPNKYEPDVEMLKNELLNFSYEVTKTNYIKYGVQLTHDDTVIALALMIYGLRHKIWIPLSAAYTLPRGSL